MITDLGPSATLRRKLAVLTVAAGLLALSGSQAVAPVAAAFVKVNAEPLEGQSYYYDALWSGTPDSTQLIPLPVAAPVTAPKPYGLNSPAGLTASGIPQPAYRAYVAAAAELARTDPGCAISWTLIAGIGRVESNHGRYAGSSIQADGLVTPPILGIRLDGSRAGTARISDSDDGRYDGDAVFDRAVGPMQFLPGTWKVYGAGANPQNMNAAALATGTYLCAGSGSLATQQGRWAAVYRYNHSDSYVSLVLSLADSYASGKVQVFPARPNGTPAPDDDAPSATPPGTPPSVPVPDPAPGATPTPSAPGRPTPTTAPTTTKPTSTTRPPVPTGTGSPSDSPTGGGSSTPPAPTSEPPGSTGPTSPETTPAPDPTTAPATTDPTTEPTPSDTTAAGPLANSTAPAAT